jgi:sarcosine oxidase
VSAHVVVLGAGLAGTAAARSIAARGHRVTVLERFEAGHRRGSSHGQERIFRLSYEEPEYVRLGLDALDGWRALERETGASILHPVGMLDHGNPARLDALERTCRDQGVPIARIDAAVAAANWPGFTFESDVLLQPEAGWLAADRAIAAFTMLAERDGASFRYGRAARAVESVGAGWRVTTGDGTLDADALVVATAGWTPDLLGPMLAAVVELPPIRVTVETVAYFRPRGDAAWPCWCHRLDPEVYGLPSPDGLVKVAEHGTGPEAHPDERPFEPTPDALARLEAYVERWLPGVEPGAVRSATCLYASTPTDDFVLDRSGSFVLGVGLGGHGFKFGPAIGERLAALVDDALDR